MSPTITATNSESPNTSAVSTTDVNSKKDVETPKFIITTPFEKNNLEKESLSKIKTTNVMDDDSDETTTPPSSDEDDYPDQVRQKKII